MSISEHLNYINFSIDPNIEYLKEGEMSQILSRALAELYQASPSNPITFLGNWLVNYSSMSQNKQLLQQRSQQRQKLRQKHQQSLKAAQQVQASELRAIQDKIQQDEQLKRQISLSLDVDDYLDTLSQRLRLRCKATGVYIGILQKVKKPITEIDDDNAHQDIDAPSVIRYISATQKFMIDKVLKEQEGEVTYSIWKLGELSPRRGSQDGENPITQTKPGVFVEDVVNDPRINFFDVPKLGSYLCFPLTLQSCQSQEAFDAAVENYRECERKRAEEFQKLRLQEEQSKQEEGEFQQPSQIKEAPFQKTEIKYVVCLDTLGQDRVFTEQQRNTAYQWVEFFRNQWDRAQSESMHQDVITHLQQVSGDLNDSDWADSDKQAADSHLKELDASFSEQIREIEADGAVLQSIRTRLLSEPFFTQLMKFKSFKTVKFMRVIQLAFFYFGIKKQKIVEPGTNRLKWKVAKNYLNENFKIHIQYSSPTGKNWYQPSLYARTLKLKEDLKKFTVQEIKRYSLSLGLLYQFLQASIELRIKEVTHRRKEYNLKLEALNAARAADEELKEKRNKAAQEALEKHRNEQNEVADESRVEFDEEAFYAEFDAVESNKPIEIPEEPVADIDGDLDWEETNP